MYKIASGNAQRRASRVHLSDLPSASSDEAPAQRRENLVLRCNQLIAAKKDCRDRAEARKIGLEISRLQHEINLLKGEPIRDVKDCFMDIARQMLVPGQFKAMMAAAERLHDERTAKIGKSGGGEG